MTVLALNAGSTSLKFALFEGDAALLRGQFGAIDTAPAGSVTAGDGSSIDAPPIDGTGQQAVLRALFGWLPEKSGTALLGIGHRIVHGGDGFTGPVLIDPGVLVAIEALTPLAPLHQGHAVAAIRTAQAEAPDLPQVACFDTAFHQTMPPVARAQPLPASLGLRRYGFHGLSYEWIAGRLPPNLAAGRVVIAHLGGGASLCALAAGRSVETTMGTTPLDGLMMATRCGSLDAGLVLHLLQQRGMSADEVSDLLYHQAGLRGVSGISDDIRVLHDSDQPAAAAAVELFCYRIAQDIGALAVVLGGLDGVVFTGGIGENDAVVRARVCERLEWLGIALAPDAKAPAGSPRGAAASRSG